MGLAAGENGSNRWNWKGNGKNLVEPGNENGNGNENEQFGTKESGI